LESEREKVARELWEAKRLPKKDPRYEEREGVHQQLEQRYNDIERERFSRQGNDPESYKYKHDARHEFQFMENKATGEKSAAMAERSDYDEKGSGPYTLRKRDEVINWRDDTKIGKTKSAQAQQDVSHRTGDDAGHLVGAEFGADPSDDRNLTRQNLTQNERGAWYKQERQLRDEVEDGRQCGVDVSVKPYQDRSSRMMKTYDVSADGGRGEARGGNVEYVDFSTRASRTYHDGSPSRAEALQARKDTHAHATEVEKNVKNQNPDQLREWQRQKDQRGAASSPPRSNAAPESAVPPPRETRAEPDPPGDSPGKGRSR